MITSLNGQRWYSCQECAYGTGSSTLADDHESDTGHLMDLFDDEGYDDDEDYDVEDYLA